MRDEWLRMIELPVGASIEITGAGIAPPGNVIESTETQSVIIQVVVTVPAKGVPLAKDPRTGQWRSGTTGDRPEWTPHTDQIHEPRREH